VENLRPYVTASVAGEPSVAVCGSDRVLGAFFSVCRHHAMTRKNDPAGQTQHLRCPYHGWTYMLEGEWRGITEFEGVYDFDRAQSGGIPIRVKTWEGFVFVNLDSQATPLDEFLSALVERVHMLRFSELKFLERRSYTLRCKRREDSSRICAQCER
jgi:choline monooxygenase